MEFAECKSFRVTAETIGCSIQTAVRIKNRMQTNPPGNDKSNQPTPELTASEAAEFLQRAHEVEKAIRDGWKPGRRLNPEQRAQVIHLLRAGKSRTEIAQDVGCSMVTVGEIKKAMRNCDAA